MNATENATATTEIVPMSIVPVSADPTAAPTAGSSVSVGEVIQATEAERAAISAYEASETKVVDLAIATLDPKDMLKKYARLGREALGLALQRKASFKAWAKQDFEKVCDQLETLVKMRVAIRDIRMGLYVRIHLWVEAAKPLCPNVEKLSYFQVANKFLSTLTFDPVALTGEIKKEWLGFVRTTVERQLSESPLTMKELDEANAARKAEIEREADARRKPKTAEEEVAAADKAEANKVKARREKDQTAIANSIGKALADGTADINDVVAVLRQTAKIHDVAMPERITGFDPATATIKDCKTLAAAMLHHGKIAEMAALRGFLDAMIQHHQTMNASAA